MSVNVCCFVGLEALSVAGFSGHLLSYGVGIVIHSATATSLSSFKESGTVRTLANKTKALLHNPAYLLPDHLLYSDM